ncbi:MAG: hypothetical protein PHY31_05180, partial [Smithellaceae bacterium]|nr:hypothetical protein [Smithellaceae bacterium]
KEISAADLKADEDKLLQREKTILINAQKLLDHAHGAHQILYSQDGAILDLLKKVTGAIEEIRKIDPSLAVSVDVLESVYYQLEEAAFGLRDYANGLSFDSERLEQVDNRLEQLTNLKRKHGGTIEAVLQKNEELENELADLHSLQDEIERISAVILEKKEKLIIQARSLSGKRKETARRLAKAIEGELKDLRMADSRFEVRFWGEPAADSEPQLNAKGMDSLEFYLSTNVGEDLKPLNRIASGGELSRIVLAMKNVLAKTASVGTVIFDEVDSGIGGATAEVVGDKIKDVSGNHQIICITHLPQIACFADRHYRVVKQVVGGRTITQMDLLSAEERLEEITRMLGGIELTEKAKAHAREMLASARKK